MYHNRISYGSHTIGLPAAVALEPACPRLPSCSAMGKKTEALLRSLKGRKEDYLDADDERAESSSSRKRKQRGSDPEKDRQDRMKQAATKSLQRQICKQCDNLSTSKHLMVAIGNHSYLMLPPRGPLVVGHCYIIPLEHEVSTRNVDNSVWEDMRNFKKSLLRMFAAQGKAVLFLELAFSAARMRRHAIVECIPIPPGAAKQAPLYFKKAIDEVEDEWSQHDSKKCIDTAAKGLRGSIPPNFPYFHVEFGLEKGYVHVIDDENNFRGENFGHTVVKGLIKLPTERPQQSVKDFLVGWDKYDWTKQLDE